MLVHKLVDPMVSSASRLTAVLAEYNAELLRILAVSVAARTMTWDERQDFLADVARIERELEDRVESQREPIAEPMDASFDILVAIDTTRDLIVRSKVALTGQALGAVAGPTSSDPLDTLE